MVFQTKTWASLVSALPKSISDKRAAISKNFSLKSYFLDFETNVRRTFPSSDLQCLPRNPRNLCVNTRIWLLATHSFRISIQKLKWNSLCSLQRRKYKERPIHICYPTFKAAPSDVRKCISVLYLVNFTRPENIRRRHTLSETGDRSEKANLGTSFHSLGQYDKARDYERK